MDTSADRFGGLWLSALTVAPTHQAIAATPKHRHCAVFPHTTTRAGAAAAPLDRAVVDVEVVSGCFEEVRWAAMNRDPADAAAAQADSHSRAASPPQPKASTGA